ncbi:2,6-dihydroxypseudooxynicotine hydrolase [Variovorax sp. HW608]|nr:2,6-dihydroxypseudooxynicotine hydrolase [Variovorax sp. HW608]
MQYFEYPPARQVLDDSVDRYLADGVHYRDLLKIRERITSWDDWPHAWAHFAREAEQRGDALLGAGHKLTAAANFVRSSIYYHFAQYFQHYHPELKRELHGHKNRVFMRGAHLLNSPVQRVVFPFRGIQIAGHLRLPAGVTNPPVAICVGGADTTKEDYFTFTDLCIERGIATFAFDGPGQGETAFEMLLIQDFEACIAAAIDYLETREEIDANRIGIVGRSMGGYFAPKAASVEPRLKALACWGVMYDREDMPTKTGIYAATGLAMSGTETLAEAVEFFKSWTLEGHVQNIKCPVFVTHGGLDSLPIEKANRFVRELANGAEVMNWDDSGHCCHDRSHIMRPAIADFLKKHL